MASMSPVSHCLACGEITQKKDRRILGSVSDKTSPGCMQKVPLWIYVIYEKLLKAKSLSANTSLWLSTSAMFIIIIIVTVLCHYHYVIDL